MSMTVNSNCAQLQGASRRAMKKIIGRANTNHKKYRLLSRLRQAELARLIGYRERHGLVIGVEGVAFVGATCLYFRRPPVGADSGLDAESFRLWARRVRLSGYHGDAVTRAHKVMGRGIPLGADTAAKAIGLSAEERRDCKITTMGAVDETREQRAAAQKVARKCRKALKRHQAGIPNRKVWLSQHTTNRDRPWIAQGISRATWFRRRRDTRETSVGPTNLYLAVGPGPVSTPRERGAGEGSRPSPGGGLSESPFLGGEVHGSRKDGLQDVADDAGGSGGLLGPTFWLLSMQAQGRA